MKVSVKPEVEGVCWISNPAGDGSGVRLWILNSAGAWAAAGAAATAALDDPLPVLPADVPLPELGPVLGDGEEGAAWLALEDESSDGAESALELSVEGEGAGAGVVLESLLAPESPGEAVAVGWSLGLGCDAGE